VLRIRARHCTVVPVNDAESSVLRIRARHCSVVPVNDAESSVLRIRARHCSVVPANFVICIIVGVTCMHPGRIIDYSSYTSKMCFNDFSNVDAAYLLPVLSTVFF